MTDVELKRAARGCSESRASLRVARLSLELARGPSTRLVGPVRPHAGQAGPENRRAGRAGTRPRPSTHQAHRSCRAPATRPARAAPPRSRTPAAGAGRAARARRAHAASPSFHSKRVRPFRLDQSAIRRADRTSRRRRRAAQSERRALRRPSISPDRRWSPRGRPWSRRSWCAELLVVQQRGLDAGGDRRVVESGRCSLRRMPRGRRQGPPAAACAMTTCAVECVREVRRYIPAMWKPASTNRISPVMPRDSGPEQKERGVGDLAELDVAAHRRAFAIDLQDVREAGDPHRRQRLDRTGRDGVHADVLRCRDRSPGSEPTPRAPPSRRPSRCSS